MSKRAEEVVSMEETRKSKVVSTIEFGQASMAGDQPIIVPEEHEEISIEEEIHIMEESLKSTSVTDRSKTPETYMHRVPLMLRNNKDNQKHFEPTLVSIGPYHYGKEKLMLAEPLKRKMVNKFILLCRKKAGSDHNILVEDLYRLILNEIVSLRKCYWMLPKKYDDKRLAWIFLVDACFVLYFIHCFTRLGFEELDMVDHQVAFSYQDLFLLENQLPFRLLQLLMVAIFPGGQGEMDMIDTFIRQKQQMIFVRTKPGYRNKLNNYFKRFQGKKKKNLPRLHEPRMMAACGSASHLLELLWRGFIEKPHEEHHKYELHLPHVPSIRNITELKAKGILFRPTETNDFADAHFIHHFFTGELKLTPIIIDVQTKVEFLNLIALEMSTDGGHNNEVTTYVWFLNTLINQPSDVVLLKEAGIIYNMLGTDEEVSRLFNEIGSNLVPNGQLYIGVASKIEEHCQTKWKVWLAKRFHAHFSSPWFMAFVYAIISLVLSAVQTYYAIKASSNECDGLCYYLKKAFLLRK